MKKTISEKLFEIYCNDRDYICKRIQTSSKSTPDYELHTLKDKIICEIKQIDPNPDERKIASDYINSSYAEHKYRPGKRVHEDLKKASTQLKTYNKKGVPTLVVVFDNVWNEIGLPFRNNQYTSDICIDAAMFGEYQIDFWPNGKPEKLKGSDLRHGGNRKCTDKMGIYISAVAVLRCNNDLSNISVNIYHNPFSEIPINTECFQSKSDKQYIKEGHPDRAGTGWRAL